MVENSRALAPEVRSFEIRVRDPLGKSVPQRLKPSLAVANYGKGKPVPFQLREFFRSLFSPGWGFQGMELFYPGENFRIAQQGDLFELKL
jgi:hypothetical protein